MYHFTSLLIMVCCISFKFIFDPVAPNGVKLNKDKIEELIADENQWLLAHMLMFNGGKTGLLLIHSKYMNLEPFPPLKMCNDLVHTILSVRNHGIFFDEKQVSAVSQCGLFHLRNIAKSKCYLNWKVPVNSCPYSHHQHHGLLQLPNQLTLYYINFSTYKIPLQNW